MASVFEINAIPDTESDNLYDITIDQSDRRTKASRYLGDSVSPPKGIAREIQNNANSLYVKMCETSGVEPIAHFTRRISKAKLPGSKAYREKRRKMNIAASERHAHIINCGDLLYGSDYPEFTISHKSRRLAAVDKPCSSHVIGQVWPRLNSQIDTRPTSFRDALVGEWW
jgi:hypothetical protein